MKIPPAAAQAPAARIPNTRGTLALLRGYGYAERAIPLGTGK